MLSHITNCIANNHLIHGAIRMQLEFNTVFHKAQDESYKTTGFFLTKYTEVYRSDELDLLLDKMFRNINNRVEQYRKEGSGFVFKKIDIFYIYINRYNPLTAGGWVEVPAYWQNRIA